jgi:hypothetical protein
MSDQDPNKLLIVRDSTIKALATKPPTSIVGALARASEKKRQSVTRITWPLRPSKLRPRLVRTLILSRAKLPAIPFSTRIESHRKKSEFYKVEERNGTSIVVLLVPPAKPLIGESDCRDGGLTR